MLKPRFLTLAGIVFLAAMSRLVPHPWNATPLAAMALFSGAHFADRKSAFLAPLAALALSDFFIGFYPTVWVTYACFAFMVFAGRGLGKNKSAVRVVSVTVVSSVAFFLATNFACWLTMAEYSKDIPGLLDCYARALPFFRNTLAGDVVYTGLLFGGFALSEKVFPVLRAPIPA